MAKNFRVYECTNCGYQTSGFLGRCPQCNEWNTLEEKIVLAATIQEHGQKTQSARPIKLQNIDISNDTRLDTGLVELNRVTGGGLVKGSVILISGNPGVGKSTLLLQLASNIAKNGTVLYVSGEESDKQIKARFSRLQLDTNSILLLCANDLDLILQSMQKTLPKLVIIDSIQTISTNTLNGTIPSGSISALRFCSIRIMECAKQHNITAIIVAHVTKEGLTAGPKTLEHIVDCVLNFEDENGDFRFLRAVKNRFGATSEIGVFSMTNKGLICVKTPSMMFISPRKNQLPSGVAFTAVCEGQRVFMVEIQALTVGAKSMVNRVFSDNIDAARVSRIAAVLEKRLGLKFSDQDIYINVGGGRRLKESAIDLSLAAALYSARCDIALQRAYVLIGEISLAGEVRLVPMLKKRIQTAISLGFDNVYTASCEDGSKQIDTVQHMQRLLFS